MKYNEPCEIAEKESVFRTKRAESTNFEEKKQCFDRIREK